MFNEGGKRLFGRTFTLAARSSTKGGELAPIRS